MLKKIMKRYLALLLAVVMVMTMDFSVQAEDNDLQSQVMETMETQRNSIISPANNIGFAIATQNITVYYEKECINYYGTIFKDEGFTIIDNADQRFANDYLYVDYSANNSRKYNQGWISIRNGKTFTVELNTFAAAVNTDTTLWYGPNADLYQPFGMVYKDESVAVLGRVGVGGYWAFVEYNASNGKRKRGFMPYHYLNWGNPNADIRTIKPSIWGDEYAADTKTTSLGKPHDVYSGPTKQYPIIDSVSGTELVRIINDPIQSGPTRVRQIAYKVPGDLDKSGYIFD